MRNSMRAALGAVLLGLLVESALAQGPMPDRADEGAVRAEAAQADVRSTNATSSSSAAEPAPVCPPTPAAPPQCLTEPDASAPHSAVPDPTIALLEFADRMRYASAAERARELARASPSAKPNGKKESGNGNGNSSPSPQQQLRLAIVLGQIRPGADLARAQQLAQQVVNSSHPEAQPIKSLARLLAARIGEQRRLEEQLERSDRQLRDQRLRLARANQRLDAVRAIERSLGSTPAERPLGPTDAATPAPAGPR